MTDTHEALTLLDGATVEPSVFALRPDYRAMLIIVSGIEPGASDASSEAMLLEAEAHARAIAAQQSVDELPHIAAWRDAYRAFGAKPQRTRNSLEALTRRAADGLPRVNRLTDIYNAVSVLHQIPLGGEDAAQYSGAPCLVRAVGDELFDTFADGQTVIEHPEVGEVVWRDAVGVTCRRWNWRQGRRTQLSDATTTALFIMDALAPVTDEALHAAATDLTSRLASLGPDVSAARRLLGA
jgi:DNA/RNA-binding domain of Phe-tRNA-synthetase-like protein